MKPQHLLLILLFFLIGAISNNDVQCAKTSIERGAVLGAFFMWHVQVHAVSYTNTRAKAQSPSHRYKPGHRFTTLLFMCGIRWLNSVCFLNLKIGEVRFFIFVFGFCHKHVFRQFHFCVTPMTRRFVYDN